MEIECERSKRGGQYSDMKERIELARIGKNKG